MNKKKQNTKSISKMRTIIILYNGRMKEIEKKCILSNGVVVYDVWTNKIYTQEYPV